jgi:hypothetical protein
MLSQGDFLASDSERHQVVARLSAAYGEGRLSLEDFSARAQAALAARTHGHLAQLTADLPGTSAITPEPRQDRRFVLALLSDVTRQGRGLIAGQTTAVCVLASCTLDLRSALVAGSEVVVDARVVLGAVKIIVPPGTQVELEGLVVLGNQVSKVSSTGLTAEAPTLRVRGVTVAGAVNVVEAGDPVADRALAEQERAPRRLIEGRQRPSHAPESAKG